MSKLSMALFNSITGQPKEKLFEMPALFQQISLEVDTEKDMIKESGKNHNAFDEIIENKTNSRSNQAFEKKNENQNSTNSMSKVAKIQSFGVDLSSHLKNEQQFPSKIDFNFNQKSLEKLNDWEFSILDLDSHMEKYNLIWMMFHSLGFLEKYEININTFGKFLFLIQEKYNYRNNPFHNFDHGFTGIIF